MTHIVSYNVHGCRGRDGRHDIGRCAAVVARLRPVIVGLQEVDSRDGQDAWTIFESTLNLHAVPGPTLLGASGRYGNLLLSRFPCLTVQHHDIGIDRREPRRVIDACLDTPLGPLRVLVTHLGLGWYERRRQLDRLAELLRADWSGAPVLVLGDLNVWWRPGTVGRRLHPALEHAGLPPSFPSGRPLFPLDQIWCYPKPLIAGTATDSSPAARIASDHLPLVARLQMRVIPEQQEYQ